MQAHELVGSDFVQVSAVSEWAAAIEMPTVGGTCDCPQIESRALTDLEPVEYQGITGTPDGNVLWFRWNGAFNEVFKVGVDQAPTKIGETSRRTRYAQLVGDRLWGATHHNVGYLDLEVLPGEGVRVFHWQPHDRVLRPGRRDVDD